MSGSIYVNVILKQGLNYNNDNTSPFQFFSKDSFSETLQLSHEILKQ